MLFLVDRIELETQGFKFFNKSFGESAIFLKTVILSTFIENQIVQLLSGAAQPQLPIRSLNELQIHLIPLEEQQQIVATIELEQVAENGAILSWIYFEQKKDKMSEVWGE